MLLVASFGLLVFGFTAFYFIVYEFPLLFLVFRVGMQWSDRVRRVRAFGKRLKTYSQSCTEEGGWQVQCRAFSSRMQGALVIECDELVVPVATEILMEILMATQLKRASQRVCRHELGRVKPALCCLIRWPSVPWCCVSVAYSPWPAGCMAASHDASARCVPLPPPHHKGAWGHIKRTN